MVTEKCFSIHTMKRVEERLSIWRWWLCMTMTGSMIFVQEVLSYTITIQRRDATRIGILPCVWSAVLRTILALLHSTDLRTKCLVDLPNITKFWAPLCGRSLTIIQIPFLWFMFFATAHYRTANVYSLLIQLNFFSRSVWTHWHMASKLWINKLLRIPTLTNFKRGYIPSNNHQ